LEALRFAIDRFAGGVILVTENEARQLLAFYFFDVQNDLEVFG